MEIINCWIGNIKGEILNYWIVLNEIVLLLNYES